MCLYADSMEIKTAKEDIVVYKGVNRGRIPFTFHPPAYPRFRYIRWIKTRYVELQPIDGYVWNGKDLSKMIIVNQGYHSCSTTEVVMQWGWNTVVECVIPKGSQYMTGDGGREYVSSNLIIKKPI